GIDTLPSEHLIDVEIAKKMPFIEGRNRIAIVILALQIKKAGANAPASRRRTRNGLGEEYRPSAAGCAAPGLKRRASIPCFIDFAVLAFHISARRVSGGAPSEILSDCGSHHAICVLR